LGKINYEATRALDFPENKCYSTNAFWNGKTGRRYNGAENHEPYTTSRPCEYPCRFLSDGVARNCTGLSADLPPPPPPIGILGYKPLRIYEISSPLNLFANKQILNLYLNFVAKVKEQKMASKKCLYGIICMVLFFGMILLGCTNPGGGAPQSVIYAGRNASGDTYTLTITESRAAYTAKAGDGYVLAIVSGSVTKTSRGTVKIFSGGVFTLMPSKGSITFEVTVTVKGIIEISGPITLDGGTGTDTVSGPGILTPIGGTADSVVKKTVEEVYQLAANLNDISSLYNKTFEQGFIEDESDIAGIYLDSAETQPLTKSTMITAGMFLYAKQSVWDEYPYSSSGNNVVAGIYRGTYTVDPSSTESITSFTLDANQLEGSGGGSSISSRGLYTKGGGDIIQGGSKIGSWAYVYYVRTKQGFVYQITSGSPGTKFYMGANAAAEVSAVSASYGVTIDLSDMAGNAWGIYAVKN
jgi:hypothetical protein